jgi:hypothetical protein
VSKRSLCRWVLSIGTAVLISGCGSVGGLRPIEDRPITLDARCEGAGPSGLREASRLAVQTGRVQALSWTVDAGTRGRCSFELADFQQTRARPHIELLARNGSGCRLMIWRDPRHITLSHAQCEKVCPTALLIEALPVIFDPAAGGCASS